MKQIVQLIAAAVIFSGCATGSPHDGKEQHTAADIRQAILVSEKIGLLCNPEIEAAIKYHAGMLKSIANPENIEAILMGSHHTAQLKVATEVLKEGSPQERCLIAISDLNRRILMAERLIDNQGWPVPRAKVDTLEMAD